ncbi:hypothetical protein AKG07_08695 [Microbacterium sp. CGR1]|uniref:glycosyltransferase family 4 protein n=1 Tax=Microbacterium sp. CGR1 TaxID=1696072 RepID=UPI00069D23F1|nr:glycosyltransferase family 4 protein [Microbacterium sp. CGR1]AKV86364.1 hypothetical protein AKG07_08695 [Microbacterium sp. CGR1]
MTTPSTPLVSFIIAADADSDAVDRSIRSCLAQSLTRIEVVCVRAGAAGSGALTHFSDERVVIITEPSDSAHAQLRRAGIDAARAPYVLVLEPGDAVQRGTAMRLHRRAVESRAQLVGFPLPATKGARSRVKRTVEARPLHGVDILRSLVPRDTEAELDISRHLFETSLLRQAYAATAPDHPLDDRATVLLAYASATSYAAVSTVEYLHRSSRRDTESEPEHRLDRALHRIASFRAIEAIIREQARHSSYPEPLLDGHTAGYLTAIGEALDAFTSLPPERRARGYEALRACVTDLDLISAAVTFAPDTIPALVAQGERLELGRTPVHSVLLTTNVLTTGGVSGVLLAQARILIGAGYRVTIVTHRAGSAESLVPEGVTLVQLTGTSRRQRVMQWAQLCRRFDVDVVVDHRVLYSRDWPSFALAARTAGAATVGWMHNFAGRPTYNGNDLQTLLHTHLRALAHLVVLSPLDVAFWKLRGIRHVSYLPNPPSPFLLDAGEVRGPKPAPLDRRLELVWWGRLEEHTKKVTQLVEVAAALQRLGVDFRLRIVGPDWADMSADRLLALAEARGVAERVEPIGPRHGADLLEVIDSSDVFVNTSIIEGYPLTLPEAQSRGLPIAMYDLPWLSLIQGNDGVISTPQQDPEALAGAIADLAVDPARYEAMSRASVAAAVEATSHDFSQLYPQLLRGELAPELSPEPTLEDGRKVLELLVFFAERSTPPPRPAPARSTTRAAALPASSRPALGIRIERVLTPIGRRVIDAAPWLRPAATNVTRILRRR